MLDIVSLAKAIQGELAADDLNHLGMAALCEFFGCFADIEGGSIEQGALDELVGFECAVRLLDHAVVHIGLADDDRGLQVMCKAAKVADIFTGKSHECDPFHDERRRRSRIHLCVSA